MKITILENQRGLLFIDGRFAGERMPGRYRTSRRRVIETLALDAAILSDHCTVDRLMQDPSVREATVLTEVPDGGVAAHYLNGRFVGLLPAGRWLFWKDAGEHRFDVPDLSDPEVRGIPESLWENLMGFARMFTVEMGCVGILSLNGKICRTLSPGRYAFWSIGAIPEVTVVDMRKKTLILTGQELLTRDKVTLRLSLVCTYKIADPLRAVTEIDDYAEQLHTAAQLAIRSYVASCTVDTLLESREEMSAYLTETLQKKAAELYLNLISADVRDVILPGEIREIMNTVLVAEKQAQAGVITRREEVASTRSLLNTARLMDENATLYRLKELEYIERICGNVGNLNLGSGDLLGQLSALVAGKSEKR